MLKNSMPPFLERIKAGPLLGDGGSIFELERRGYIQAGPYTPEVVLEHPDVVLQLHRDYLRSGSEVLQAVAFYGSEDKVENWSSLNREAVALARQAAGQEAYVAGGLSPTPSFRAKEPAGRVRHLMERHLMGQLEAGVHLVIGETFLWLEEALLALKVIKSANQVAVITMNIPAQGSRDGYSPAECAGRLEQAGADMVGVNCSFGPKTALPVALEMKRAVTCPVVCQPIAYHNRSDAPFEQWDEFPLSLEPFQITRQAMGEFASKASEEGIALIGGCCGVGPHHLRAMAEALGRKTPSSGKSPDMSRHMIAEVRERFNKEAPPRPGAASRA